jgi:protein SCO1/2
MKKLVLGGLIVVAAVVGIWGETFSRAYTFRGSLIDPPTPAPNFTLNDQHGQPFRLSDQRGKLVLIFFGYTNCPDVCPITLAQFKQIRTQLDNQAEKVRFVFVTIDPQRDTPERMNLYLGAIDPNIVGLTGSQADLEPAWRDYGVYRQNQPLASGDDNLDAIEHSASMYLVDAQGNLRLTYPSGLTNDDLLQDIRYLLRKG